jgi:hypothetical protein
MNPADSHIPSEISNRLLQKLLQTPENSHCIDCNASATFASLAHGTFLCVLCATSHEHYGFSLLKPLNSNWTLSELKLMTSGGNAAFEDFLQIYKLKDLPIDFIYRTKAVYFYREVLETIAQRGSFEGTYPTPEEGLESVEEIDLDSNSTEESVENKSKWQWLASLYKKYPSLSQKSFETVCSSVRKCRNIVSVDGILGSAKKRFEEFSVNKVKNEAHKFIEDIEKYFSSSGRYFDITLSCSNSEKSLEPELKY